MPLTLTLTLALTQDKTTLVSTGDFDEAVEARVNVLKELMQARIADGKEFEVQRIEQRIQKLRGAVARLSLIHISEPTRPY